MDANRRALDFGLAVLLTTVGVALSWFLAGGLPTIGIDDAAITRSYSENIANGAGYVYNVGGERVEGSTALLWVLILTVPYMLTPTPEYAILGIGFALAILAVYCTLRLTRLTAWRLETQALVPVGAVCVFLLANPGYFMWTVWSMMEIGLWSSLLMALLLCLADGSERGEGAPGAVITVILAALLPIVRPEGIAVTLGLLVLALLLRPEIWRRVLVSIVAAIASVGAITGFRLSYFGYPVPNTFYAKVSSDTIQGLKDGLKYFVDFVHGLPFAELLVLVWAAAAVWAVLRLQTPGARSVLLMAAAVFGLLAVYAALGGDHFVLWRFYQPTVPLLAIGTALVVGVGVKAARDVSEAGELHTSVTVASWVFAIAAFVSGAMFYYQSRFDVTKEYTLVERGLAFGNYLNTSDPRPSIGTGPAGGIALAYDGHIYDLLGLNWPEMAHANPIKEGMRNPRELRKRRVLEVSPRRPDGL